MKNIHVLPTDKPSKLLKDIVDETYQFKKEATFGNRFELPLNIYITNDEIPKLDEWGLNTKNNVVFKSKGFALDDYDKKNCRKIILTTDQDLIKDGVQAIDDEFLEWFVKNPSCEYVEVEPYHIIPSYLMSNKEPLVGYKIIIPKEDPKQEIILSEEDAKIFIDAMIQAPEPSEKLKQAFKNFHKQETLEEAAEKYADIHAECYDLVNCSAHINNRNLVETAYKAGAEWQAKRMYSEEEVGELVYNIIGEYGKYYGIMIDGSKLNELFEQFKKK